ncbi:hypothetical protein DX873_09485 [Flagellimonas nanhaiensis]|uniref:Uncharacterized protein n=1 Tax=Flagellimonas nanhaiensis TaxID=2292706 RepID=A0A371JQ10_9FLAO|nr:hypothetical protein DX873_09485 [Allomuricauda nanhaiensis]
MLTHISSYGQYDWKYGELVLKNNDTIKGFIQIPMISRGTLTNSKKIKFKENLEGKITRYDHTSANKLIFKDLNNENSLFEYIRTSPSKVQLFKRIYTGNKIRLYARMVSDVSHSHPDANGFVQKTVWRPSDFNEYYAQRKYERNATALIKVMGPFVFQKSFSKNAMKYFADCPDLVAKLKNRTLKESDLLSIIQEYDECE